MSSTAISAEQFFELVDEVLKEVRRAPLPPDSPQRRIIEVMPDDRVLQILAGPGSGKTEMLVWRVLFELFVRKTEANRVMVTTFTRKAAMELGVRVVERSDALLKVAKKRGLKLKDPLVHDLRIGTIHSLCDALLAEFDKGYMEAGTQLIDELEARVRMARILGYQFRNAKKRIFDNQRLVSLFRPPWKDDNWPRSTMDRVDLMISILNQHVESWIPRCRDGNIENGLQIFEDSKDLTTDLEKLHARWEEYMNKEHVLDFATLQLRFLGQQTTILKQLNHVFVDEFQDTNPIQYRIHTKWLANPSIRLTVVGDDDQSIYRFRGSDIKCFNDLHPQCQAQGVPYRMEKLEENWRSTKTIVRFGQKFKRATILQRRSMHKHIRPAPKAIGGQNIRLLQGKWSDLCGCVARELAAIGLGSLPAGGGASTEETGAILLFSTSEKVFAKRGASVASEFRASLETQGLRVYNPRNKTAAREGSPVFELLALLSYLIDPVTKAPVGKRGNRNEVWASNRKPPYAAAAVSAPPPFNISQDYINFQKKFGKGEGGTIESPASDRAELFKYIDTIRDNLIAANHPRLTISGLIARLLTFPRYRNVGFDISLFRQALFTTLLEANIAPTRLSHGSLDMPIKIERNEQGKIVWPKEYWSFLNVIGSLLANADLDDVEVDAFSEYAIPMLTFHQTKGLEFDHVYLGATGRVPSQHAVLQTLLFSGNPVQFGLENGQPHSDQKEIVELSEADRDRELYVAMTRAKQTLTILFDPNDDRPFMKLHPAIEALFSKVPAKRYQGNANVSYREFHYE